MYQSNYKRYKQHKRKRIYKTFAILLLLFVVGFSAAYFFSKDDFSLFDMSFLKPKTEQAPPEEDFDYKLEIVEPEIKEEEEKPKEIITRAKYIDVTKVSDENYVSEIFDLIENTEINSLVIPMKNRDGSFNYISKLDYTTVSFIGTDLTEFIAKFSNNDVSLIAEVAMYGDDHYAKNYTNTAVKTNTGQGTFYDYTWERWINPYSEEGDIYLKAVLSEIKSLGFDEIMLSNISFPPKGSVGLVDYAETDIPKEEIFAVRLGEFKELLGDTRMSVCIMPFTLEETSHTYEDVNAFSEICDTLYADLTESTDKTKIENIPNIGYISSEINSKNYIIK